MQRSHRLPPTRESLISCFTRSVLIALLAIPCLAFASPADLPTTAVLTFEESVFPVYVGTGTGKEVAFKAEPKYEGNKLSRGTIEIGVVRRPEQKLPSMGYVLDKTAGKLYLDLNMNGDLTDDPNGVVVKDKSQPYYDIFNNIRFTLAKGEMRIPYVMSVMFYSDRPQASINSGWSGEFTLHGHKWNLQVSDGLEADLRHAQLLFGRDKPSVMSPRMACREIFLEGRLYQLSFAFVSAGDKVNIEALLQPTDADLGRVRLTGTHVARLALESGNSQGTVLENPPAEFQLPEGNWRIQSVQLKSGDKEFNLADAYKLPHIVVSPGQTAEFAFGAPLKNKVDFGNAVGSQVTLNYKLVDAAGHEYRSLNYGPNPPQFEVYKAGKKIDSGKFEFG